MKASLCISSAICGLWLSTAGINPPYIYWQTAGTLPFFVWSAVEAMLALLLLLVAVRALKPPNSVTMASFMISGLALLSSAEFCFWIVASNDPYPVLLRQMIGAWLAPPFLLVSVLTIDWRRLGDAIRWSVRDTARVVGIALAVAATGAMVVLLFRNIYRPFYTALDTMMFAIVVSGVSVALALAFRVIGRADA